MPCEYAPFKNAIATDTKEALNAQIYVAYGQWTPMTGLLFPYVDMLKV